MLDEELQLTSLSILLDMGQLAAALLAQQPEEAFALAAEEHEVAHEVAHAAGAESSKAPRLVLVSAFWPQPATAMATQIPMVASMVFMILYILHLGSNASIGQGLSEAWVSFQSISIAPLLPPPTARWAIPGGFGGAGGRFGGVGWQE